MTDREPPMGEEPLVFTAPVELSLSQQLRLIVQEELEELTLRYPDEDEVSGVIEDAIQRDFQVLRELNGQTF